jgi:prolyl-tRNA editing enzyme YbaK/EbsC (Cys-tRNA(Pro) deacylase)
VTTARVFDYLLGRGVPFAVFPRKGAATPLTAAEQYGLAEELVRTVALSAAVGPALAVVPWSHHLDVDLARAALRDPAARAATEDEIDERFPGYEPNSIPPLGLFFLMPMVVDPAVVRLRQVAFPAGKTSCLVCAKRSQLFRGDVYLVAPLVEASLPERLPGAGPRGERSATDLAGTAPTP